MKVNTLEEIAQYISEKAENKNNNFGSIILTIMIVGIVVNLIRVVQECNRNKTQKMNDIEKNKYNTQFIKNICLNRGWFAKMRIRKTIRQQLGQEQYKTYGKILLESIMDTGENLTDEKIIKLLEVSNNV